MLERAHPSTLLKPLYLNQAPPAAIREYKVIEEILFLYGRIFDFYGKGICATYIVGRQNNHQIPTTIVG